MSDQSFGQGGLNPYLDADELVERIGLTENEIDWRKQFIGFDETDERRLSDLEPLLRRNQERIADDFYDNLLQYEQTRDVIGRSTKNFDGLKQTQRAYLVSLAAGEYDREYFRNRARIGKLHEMLDMPLKHYVGQYGVYYDLLLPQLNERIQNQVVEAIEEWAQEYDAEGPTSGMERLAGALGFETEDDTADGLDESFERTVRGAIDDGMMDVLSLLRIINLDMQVATDTYVDAYAGRLENEIDRREQLAREVETDVENPVAELHEASEMISNRAQRIGERTAEQATAVDHVAGELGEVSAAVEEVASVSDEVRRESERTERLAADGSKAADKALSELVAIEDAVDRVSSAAATLEERLEEIDETVDRLDELTTRTTILAKNARIESSRSDGETAIEALEVIATEVGSFAEQTRADLSAIERAVEDVATDAEETIKAADEAVERVDAGGNQIRGTVDSFEEIHEAARSTATGMDDVSAAADQQAHSVESIADLVEELSTTADDVAEATESVAAASEEQTASLQAVGKTVSRLTTESEPAEQPVYERLAE
ncbi:chemotaxis protein [Natronolimnobius sp. AArcel1]|uniref:globin-coupled sensor protein n=1 Tax=Natronolimnobius sp. AArcel1 TaxID=1679093 RepID=UPI0013ECADFF|nr:globin-coupled sensor protein [Natronolimnobius sp. AArcel1]NGM70352.1 chemotaxis protein [Natronolimnobius sp. AArcel1]